MTEISFLHLRRFESSSSSLSPLSRNTIYRIYSMTKPIVSIALLQLVAAGRLSLDDELSKFLPYFAEQRVLVGGTVESPITEPPRTPITIRHLLTHTSGLCYGIFGNLLSDQLLRRSVGEASAKAWYSDMDMRSLLSKHVAKVPLAFHPGERFLYGLSTDVLGVVIESVTGTSLHEHLKGAMFDKIGMSDTSFVVDPHDLHRLSPCFDFLPGFGYKPATNPEIARHELNLDFLSGGGGLVSTIDDYCLLVATLLRGGVAPNGVVMLPKELLDLMTTNQVRGGGTTTLPGGLGLDNQYLLTMASRTQTKHPLLLSPPPPPPSAPRRRFPPRLEFRLLLH